VFVSLSLYHISAAVVLGNIARLVVHENVPYALGMQFALPDNAALAITNALYDALLQGRSVEEAMRAMRAGLENNAMLQNTQWLAGVPVLYTSLREPAPALKLTIGQPTLVPDPVRFAHTFDLSALSTPQHFFGRADAISETLQALQDTSKRGFVVLHGMGGIGKTTLALAVATRISWNYQDRVLAYSFETFARFAFEGDRTRTTVDPQFAERFYSKLASFYKVEDPSQYKETRDLQDAIKQQRNHTRSLLILDNIETLVYAQKQKDSNALQLAAFIRDLQQGEGDILLTTREMLPSDWGERKDIHLVGLNDDAGAELFLASIANDRKHAAAKKDRIALSQYVQGHPLCIRLLAGRFSDDKGGDLATFRKNLPGELGRSKQATPTSYDDPNRHETINNCIAYSVRRLIPEQANIFYTIGIFRAPFLLPFAEAVLNDEEHTTEKYLQDLVRLGLLERMYVSVEEGGYFELYELHSMLRLHIKSNIAALDTETRRRYGLVYANLARQLVGGYDNSVPRRYLLRQSLPDCEAALAEEDIESTIRSTIAYYLVLPYVRMGQVKYALALCKQVLVTCQEIGDVRRIAITQSLMADVLVQQGRMSEAMELYEQSLVTLQELGDVRTIAATQDSMANVLMQQGRANEAMKLYEQSLKTYQELGDVRRIAATQHAMAEVLARQGRAIVGTQYTMAEMLMQLEPASKAIELYEQSLKTRQELGDIRGIATTQNAMADVLVQQGRMDEAMELYEQSLKAKLKLGDMREIAVAQNAMADILRQQGRVVEAMELYEQLLVTVQELEDVRLIAVALMNFGYLLWQQEEYVKALAILWRAYKSLSEHDFPRDSQDMKSTLVSFKKRFSGEEQVFDALWLQATSEPQPIWLNDVLVGSSAMNDDTAAEKELDEIGQAIIAFVGAENWDATQQVVEAQQEILFRPETELVFEWNIEQSKAGGEQHEVETLEMHLAVLRACKADGIVVAFERVRAVGQEEG